MKKLYLTPTLLNSWQFYTHCQEEQEQEAKQDFLNCLRKIKTEPTQAMLRGIQFENDVWACANNQILTDDDTVCEIAQIIKDGLWQEAVSKELLAFKDYKIYLYGICDIIKQDTIYDIKRVKKYDIGKYLKSFQHLVYLYCTKMNRFQYLISDGSFVYKEDYYSSDENEHKLITGVLEFLGWLEINDLFDDYTKNWIFNKE